MKAKKLFVAFFACALLICAMGISAYAAEATNEAAIEGTSYPTLEVAIEAAEPGAKIQLLSDVTIENEVEITKAVTIDGTNGAGKYTITSTTKRAFRVFAHAAFQNVNIVNTIDGGRCVDTREGGITVTLENVVLTAEGVNSQPLTIGGEDTEAITVNVNSSAIYAGQSGYGIISFVPTNLTIENSTVSGYAALYIKEGSAGSVIDVTGTSVLSSKNVYSEESNDFGTIVFEESGITLTVEENASVTAETTGKAVSAAIAFDGNANTVTVAGTLSATGSSASLLDGYVASGEATLKVTNAAVETALEEEGYTVSEDGKLAAVAKVGDVSYGHLADAIAAAENGTVTLLANVTLTEKIQIQNAVTIDGAEHTITTKAEKAFEVYANADFENVTIVNTANKGRCVDTRVGNITVNLTNVTLEATKGYNTQPITIGGSDTTTTTVNVTSSAINAGGSGYGIIVFVPAELTVKDSTVEGFAALYMKAGSAGSVVSVTGASELKSTNTISAATNDFGTIVFEDSSITLTIDENASVSAVSTGAAQGAAIDCRGNANTVVVNGTVSATGTNPVMLKSMGESNITVANVETKTALQNAGYSVDESGKVALKGEPEWKNATDAGAYKEGDSLYGMMRFLFSVKPAEGERIQRVGIMYTAANILDNKDLTTSAKKKYSEGMVGENFNGAFYGDVVRIQEGSTSACYAMAYVTTSTGTYWSEVVKCEPNWNVVFEGYTGGAQE